MRLRKTPKTALCLFPASEQPRFHPRFDAVFCLRIRQARSD